MEETSTDTGLVQPTFRLPAVLESIRSYHHRLAPIIDIDNGLPGLRFLRDDVERDCEKHPHSSTNAPYLVAVWDELIHAHHPVALFRVFDKIKVDIVAENGARWVRVNTIKNARLMMEFCEIDFYLTSDDEDDVQPRLELDNSVLRMGRELLAAARANPISTGPSTVTPQVTMCLTRLDPRNEPDLRIERTIQSLRDMGIDVQLGERPFPPPVIKTPKPLEPTTNINLDLSALIALVSDTSHSPLPRTDQEAHARFKPPQSYLDGKRDGDKFLARQNHSLNDVGDAQITRENSGQHSRALATQVIREMNKGILQEIDDRISTTVTFWTTAEARLRCLQIVTKIGGERERQRAGAMLSCTSIARIGGLDDAKTKTPGDVYWEHSRYPGGFLPLVPVRVYPSILPAVQDEDRKSMTSFFDALARTCTGILFHETGPVSAPSSIPTNEPFFEEVTPAAQTSVSKLTMHTVTSMLAGTSRGHTTLTTNKTSVKVVLKEMQRVCGISGYDSDHEIDSEKAVLWILDPRSLSEGMRSEWAMGT